MIKLDVIEPVSEPAEWENPLVTVEKPNGKLRMCLDPRDLNKAIKGQNYKLPTAEELFSEMTGARYFSKLDASNGYWQIKTDTESSKLLTFAAPFGRFCFKRPPYGILSASEIFQADISKIIEGLEGSRNSQDDIIVWGKTLTEHNNRVSKVMTKISESGLKLSKSKCVFGVQSITFLGHKSSSNGTSPDPKKVKTISEMAKPTSKTDLQRFLGMVAYLWKFIPNLSDKTKELRELILKDTVWDFNQIHERKFDELKLTISNCASLKFFDPKLQTKITCDASKFGLGATHEQKFNDNWEPIAFASRTLTPAEINYCLIIAQINYWSKFHEYVYGRKFLIENDHKPLKPF